MSKKKPLYCYQSMQGVSITSDGRSRPCCAAPALFDIDTYTTKYDEERNKNLGPPHRKYEIAHNVNDFVNTAALKKYDNNCETVNGLIFVVLAKIWKNLV